MHYRLPSSSRVLTRVSRLKHQCNVLYSSIADSAFASKQATALWTAVELCWSGEVFMPQLAHRFWKLTLQTLSRYRTWLERNLSALDTSAKPLRSALEEKVCSSHLSGIHLLNLSRVEVRAHHDLGRPVKIMRSPLLRLPRRIRICVRCHSLW